MKQTHIMPMLRIIGSGLRGREEKSPTGESRVILEFLRKSHPKASNGISGKRHADAFSEG